MVNSLGATRFDVAVSAMRGLLDPPAWVEDTENTPGIILSALMTFPARYCFSVVGKAEEGFKEDMVATIARVCQTTIDVDKDVKVCSSASLTPLFMC